MLTRCTHCDYQNSPGNRFCGMCGSPMWTTSEATAPQPAPNPETRPTVAGPSFLGLAEPDREMGYLLEDEPLGRRWPLFLAVVLLLLSGAFLAWRWRSEGHPWRALMASRRMLGAAGDSRPTGQESDAITEAQNRGESGDSAAPGQPSVNTEPTPASESRQSPSTEVSPSTPNQPTSAPAPTQAGPVQPPPVESVKPARAQGKQSSPQVQRQDLVARGESYLYGNGVAKDCDRARTNLFIAAEQEDPDAQSILGTMFATGHCVTADLPTAYQWLSRAERRDRNNARIASNLRTVWNEMSAEQQQAALRSSK